MKKSTRVVLGSVMTMALCASLIAGSTLALFSNEANVDVAITSGKVDLKASVKDGFLQGFSAAWDETTKTYTEQKVTTDGIFTTGGTYAYADGKLTLGGIAPGDGVEFDLNIENKSSIKINYRVQLTVPETMESGDPQGAVAQALEVSFAGKDPVKIGTHTTIAQDWVKDVPVGENIAPVHVKIKLPWEAGNAYEEQGCELKVGVYAIQSNARVTDPTPGAFTIYNPVDLYSFATEVNNGNDFAGETVELGSDIYLSEPVAAGYRMVRRSAYALADTAPVSITDTPWTPIGTDGTAFKGTFDGHGYTIYGLNATGENKSAGLFGVVEDATIKNVEFANVTVSATGEGSVAGIVAAEARGTTTLSGVTVKNSTVSGDCMTGGLVGKTAEGAALTVQDSSSELVSEGGDKLETEWPENNNTAEPESSVFVIPSSEGLRAFAKLVNEGRSFAGITVVLTTDVDLSGENWTPAGTNANPFTGTFMGGTIGADGTVVPTPRTISNMKIELSKEDNNEFAGFFAVTENCEISALVFKNASVSNEYYKTSSEEGKSGYVGKNAVLIGLAKGSTTINNVVVGDEAEPESNRITVTSGKTASVFIAESDASATVIAFENCINYGNICAPKATAFVSQVNSNQSDSAVIIKNCLNEGNITMPQDETKVAGKKDNRHIVMGAFIGYNQNAKKLLLINCVNNGNITAKSTYSVDKINVGGLISSARGTTNSVLVDCINRGNIVVDLEDTTIAREFEIGGIVGSKGVTMYHIEQLGDITVSSKCNVTLNVGGVSGNEDGNNLHMKARAEYAEVPIPEEEPREERYSFYNEIGEDGNPERPSNFSNIVCSDILVTCPDTAVVNLGGVTGRGRADDTVDSTFVSIYAVINGGNLFNKTFGDTLVLGGMSGQNEYAVTNSILHIASAQDRGFDCTISWGIE